MSNWGNGTKEVIASYENGQMIRLVVDGREQATPPIQDMKSITTVREMTKDEFSRTYGTWSGYK